MLGLKTLIARLLLLTVLAVGSLFLGTRVLAQSLQELDQEIGGIRENIKTLQSRAASLEDELFLLAQGISQVELEITRIEQELELRNIQIAQLDTSIQKNEERLKERRGRMALFVRTLNEQDAVPPLIRILSTSSLKDTVAEIAAVEQAQGKLLDFVQRLHEDEMLLEQTRNEVLLEKNTHEELSALAEIARDELAIQRFEREHVLAETKGSESSFFQKLKEITFLRTALYFIEDAGFKLRFEEAYAIAQPYAEKTGVRPAFLLAVLQKESRLGQRVGTGYWRTDMHPRDWEAFLQITAELNLDPETTPVSKKPNYGWGGAMGSAQFLPTTWLSWRDKIITLTGHNPPSPWDVHDAFAAAALKLAAAGADRQLFDAEWKAAMIYFAGGNWDDPAFAFYGDSVMGLSQRFEDQISELTQAPIH